MALTSRTLQASRLSVAQKQIVNRALTAGGALDDALNESQCSYLAARVAVDLGYDNLLVNPTAISPFFETRELDTLRLDGTEFLPLFEALVSASPDADTYFGCLAALHKRRLKYRRILETQPIPTLNQVGPRGLLQYGSLNAGALVGFMFWRKWFFDIDNRAGQETGYIFEPIVARCIGGQPYSGKKSPVKHRLKPEQRRQVDCIFEKNAYEIKLRVTVAASGQGRWGEEKDFPADCSSSGFKPILLVFDDTQADKLDELSALFRREGGNVFIGEAAWNHLEELAGATMSTFLEKYVRKPLKRLLDEAPQRDNLPDLHLSTDGRHITVQIADEKLTIIRPTSAGAEGKAEASEEDVTSPL